MCPECVKEKNAFNKSHGIESGWQEYRLDLLKRISEEDIIAPARKENPNIKITIKYPNWAESYQETGYNPKEQRELFDNIYTGTETRDPVSTDQHLPRYLSYSLMTYFENMWPDHNGGGWFDTFDMHITEHYLEQAYLTAFSQPKELMLFCFQSIYDNMFTPSLGFQLDKLDDVMDKAGKPAGITCYLPDNCQGEDNIQDFLGMVGLPIVCSPYFPDKENQIMLTRSSAYDPDIIEKLEKYLREKGGNVLVTTGFWEAVGEKGYDLTSIRLRGRKISANRYRVESAAIKGHPTYSFPYSDKPVTIPVAEFRNNSTWAVVKASHDEESYGILLRDDYCDGHIWTIAAPDAFPDYYRLPSEVLSRIRQALPVNGVWFEGPSRISLFNYDNDSFIIYPYVMDNVQHEEILVHVAGAKALEASPKRFPMENSRIEPLYYEGDEAVFKLGTDPGVFRIYSIVR